MKTRVNQILNASRFIFERFPFAMATAIIGSILIMIMIGGKSESQLIPKVTMTLSLGIPLFTAAKLFIEGDNSDAKELWITRGGVLALLSGYFFFLLNHTIDKGGIGLQFAIFHIVLLLAISIAPYVWSKDIKSFAKFNSTLFVHILEAFVASIILFATLSLALVALDNLIGIHVGGNVYSRMAVFIFGVFNTGYILSGIETDFDYSESSFVTSRFYKVLSQYILIPVVCIYMLILYIYGVKVLLAGANLEHWASEMTIWFFVVGVFTFLMNYVYRGSEYGLSRFYMKWFFITALPLTFLLFYITYTTIKYEGVTPGLYYAALLGVWILCTSVYIIWSSVDNIKWIPISLIGVGLFSVIGPWSVCNAVSGSQSQRLISDLKKAKIIVDDALVAKEQMPKWTPRKPNHYSLLDELSDFSEVRKYDKNSVLPEDMDYNYFRYAAHSSIDNVSIEAGVKVEHIYVQKEKSNPLNIEGYSKLIQVNLRENREVKIEDYALTLNKSNLKIDHDGHLTTIDLSLLVNQYQENKRSSYEYSGQYLNLLVSSNFVHARKKEGELTIDNADILLFIKDNRSE